MHFFRVARLLPTVAPLVAVAAFAQATGSQTLSLIPVPREVRPAMAQTLANGVQINCSAPCPAEDLFAIEDLKG